MAITNGVKIFYLSKIGKWFYWCSSA